MKAKLAFISAHGSTYSIRLLCSVLDDRQGLIDG